MGRDNLEIEKYSWFANLQELGLNLLRKKRKVLGLTQTQMAQKIGIDQSRISRIERGSGTPKDYPTASIIAYYYRLNQEEKNNWFRLLYGHSPKESQRNLTAKNEMLIKSQQGYIQAQEILISLLDADNKKLVNDFECYLERETIGVLKNFLTDPALSDTDRNKIIAQLQKLYETFQGDSLKDLTIRQNAIYLLGNFAAAQTYDFISAVWSSETHPWVTRGALVVLSEGSKYDEFIYLTKNNDLARQVARTYPRVYYGDQSSETGLFIDDGRSTYSRTLRYYLSNHPRYLSKPGLSLVLSLIRDILETKGVQPLLKSQELSALLYQTLTMEPIHPLAQREWYELVRSMRPIHEKLQEAAIHSKGRFQDANNNF